MCSSLAIIIGKTSTVIDLSKLEIQKLFYKSKVCVRKQRKLKSDINPTHRRTLRLTKYIYLSSYCLRILRVAAWVNFTVF